MKIMIVRHGKVNMKWPKMCSSEDFDKACAEYDRSDLESINIIPLDEPADRIYVSCYEVQILPEFCFLIRNIMKCWKLVKFH